MSKQDQWTSKLGFILAAADPLLDWAPSGSSRI